MLQLVCQLPVLYPVGMTRMELGREVLYPRLYYFPIPIPILIMIPTLG